MASRTAERLLLACQKGDVTTCQNLLRQGRGFGAPALFIAVQNNQKNVQLAIDDLSGGFNVSLGWV